MARVVLRKKSFVEGAAAHHRETQSEVSSVAKRVEARANTNLARVRATTDHKKISGPAHQTEIDSSYGVGKYGALDRLVIMSGPGVMALEFGHFPSGFFEPDKYGEYLGKDGPVYTKAPHGLYILTGAAGFGGLTSMSSGRRRGKR